MVDAGVTAQDIDEVMLVGGQTRMPVVQDRLTKFFGKPPSKGVHPDEAVAIGAALYGWSLQESSDLKLQLLDVIPMAIGIEQAGGTMHVVFPRNAAIPNARTVAATNSVDGQSALVVRIFQGDQAETARNEILGEFTFSGVRPARAGETRLEILFEVNVEGILAMSARDLDTGPPDEDDGARRLELSRPPATPGLPRPPGRAAGGRRGRRRAAAPLRRRPPPAGAGGAAAAAIRPSAARPAAAACARRGPAAAAACGGLHLAARLRRRRAAAHRRARPGRAAAAAARPAASAPGPAGRPPPPRRAPLVAPARASPGRRRRARTAAVPSAAGPGPARSLRRPAAAARRGRGPRGPRRSGRYTGISPGRPRSPGAARATMRAGVTGRPSADSMSRGAGPPQAGAAAPGASRRRAGRARGRGRGRVEPAARVRRRVGDACRRAPTRTATLGTNVHQKSMNGYDDT